MEHVRFVLLLEMACKMNTHLTRATQKKIRRENAKRVRRDERESE